MKTVCASKGVVTTVFTIVIVMLPIPIAPSRIRNMVNNMFDNIWKVLTITPQIERTIERIMREDDDDDPATDK